MIEFPIFDRHNWKNCVTRTRNFKNIAIFMIIDFQNPDLTFISFYIGCGNV